MKPRDGESTHLSLRSWLIASVGKKMRWDATPGQHSHKTKRPKLSKVLTWSKPYLRMKPREKKENELKSQQMDKLAEKRKELKSMSLEDLKKRLTKKGLESNGKKEEL